MEYVGRQLSPADLDCIERELAITLPPSYRQFLLTYNGGQPSPAAFPIWGMPNNPYGIIHVFYGVDSKIDGCDLVWGYRVFSQDTPPDLFPIARTPSGDEICVSLFGEDEGIVFLWDYYNAPRDPGSREGLYFLASSFDGFLEGISSEEELNRTEI